MTAVQSIAPVCCEFSSLIVILILNSEKQTSLGSLAVKNSKQTQNTNMDSK